MRGDARSEATIGRLLVMFDHEGCVLCLLSLRPSFLSPLYSPVCVQEHPVNTG